MNPFARKLQQRLRTNPEIWFSLLAKPTAETVQTIRDYGLLQSNLSPSLMPWIPALFPIWENQACHGSELLTDLLDLLSEHRLSYKEADDQILRSDLLRIRILASTPGSFPFSPITIQERLLQYLPSADVLADLPELDIIYFSKEELVPLAEDLSNYYLTPHSRRYLQNLFFPERRQAILIILAYIAKTYPLLETCRLAYALMLSLNDPAIWGQHLFCQRLIVNRFWDYRACELI